MKSWIQNDFNFFYLKFTDKHLPNASEIIAKANKLTIKITTPLKWGIISTATIYIMKPLATDLICYFVNDIQPPHELIFKSKFLYNVTQSPIYELTYLYQVYLTIQAGVFAVSMDVISD